MDGKPHAPRQVSRYDILWRKLFGLKGEGPEPLAVVGVEGFGYDDLELAALRGMVPCLVFDEKAAAGAGTFSGIALAPRVGGFLVRVEQIYVESTIAGAVFVGIMNAASLGGMASGNAQAPRDARFPNSTAQPIGTYNGTQAAVPFIGGLKISVLANTPLFLPVPFVLKSNIGETTATIPALGVFHGTANSDIRAGFVYRFRPIEVGEINP